MRAMMLNRIVSLNECETPLDVADVPAPEPGPGDVLLRVQVCGVCHTELDEIEGRTPPPVFPIIPGHEVVGIVERVGDGVTKHQPGDRVGVGWIHSSTGARDENLAPEFRATGRDANGGYAEFMTVGQNYAYRIPDAFADEQAAPLLCAGTVGYRALKLAGLTDGEPLGLTGFGGSAHIVLQLARYQYPNSEIHVFARDPQAQEFARELGAVWSGGTKDRAPERLQAIVDTTPAWTPVVEALANLRPGGRLVINAIRKEAGDQEYLQHLKYEEHLWLEREIKSVANVTQFDFEEFLPLAAAAGIRPEVQLYPLSEANRALVELKRGPVKGAKVLRVSE